MDEQLKRRLVGATVLVALAIIFLPMLLEHEPANLKPLPMEPIPEEPPRQFDEKLLKEAAQEAASGPAQKPEAPPPAARTPSAGETVAKPSGQLVAEKPAPAKPASKPPARKENVGKKGSPSAWAVQVASLSSLENARKLVKKLRQAGLDTMDPKPVKVKGKRYYRVLVGPEVKKKNAERHQALIQKLTGTRGRVVRYP